MMSIEALWPEADYHKVADETLDELIDLVGKLESELDDVDITLSMGVLNINLGEKFQNKAWVINKQTPNRQVWWSSPLSGPRRYEYDGKENGQQSTRWKFTRDASQSLQANLRDELRKVTGLDL